MLTYQFNWFLQKKSFILLLFYWPSIEIPKILLLVYSIALRAGVSKTRRLRQIC